MKKEVIPVNFNFLSIGKDLKLLIKGPVEWEVCQFTVGIYGHL